MAEIQRDITRGVLAVLFIVTLIGSSIWILRPFIGAIVWAATIVVATWPLMISVQAWLWGKRSLAVAVMTLLLLCVLVVPLTFAIGTIVSNVDEIAAWAKSLAAFKMPSPPEWVVNLPFVGAKAVELWERVAAVRIQEVTAGAAPYAGGRDHMVCRPGGQYRRLISGISVNGHSRGRPVCQWRACDTRLVRFGRRLAGPGGENAVLLAGQTIRGVALGLVVTALAQTVWGGLGLMFAGVPFAGILTAVMLLLCIAQIGVVPVLGPAVAWLYWAGHSAWGTFLLVWMIVATTMDNFLRPILIKQGADLPLLLVFAGVVGGLLAFGLIGIFVGPVVLAVADVLLKAWIDGDPKEAETTE